MKKKITITCTGCGKDLLKDGGTYNSKRKFGQTKFYHQDCWRKHVSAKGAIITPSSRNVYQYGNYGT